ncbi:MAG TPA: HAD family hydrolase [Micromonosporaceae bacterium]
MLFDLDGTLVDTTYVHTVVWWEAFARHGYQIPMAQIHRAIGMGSDQLIPHLLGHAPTPARQRALRAEHDQEYRRYWGRLCPLPGARDLVRWCAERGYQVVLASSGSAEEVRMLRDLLDVDPLVAAATSADDASVSKPAPDLLHAALDQVGADHAEAVLVGDSVWDVLAARRCGLPCVGVECGGTSAAELRAAGAVEVHPSPAQLCQVWAERGGPG